MNIHTFLSEEDRRFRLTLETQADSIQRLYELEQIWDDVIIKLLDQDMDADQGMAMILFHYCRSQMSLASINLMRCHASLSFSPCRNACEAVMQFYCVNERLGGTWEDYMADNAKSATNRLRNLMASGKDCTSRSSIDVLLTCFDLYSRFGTHSRLSAFSRRLHSIGSEEEPIVVWSDFHELEPSTMRMHLALLINVFATIIMMFRPFIQHNIEVSMSWWQQLEDIGLWAARSFSQHTSKI